MNDLLLRAYHHLPAPARSLAASLHGYYLAAWRYGPESERLVEAALEREQWSAAQWEQWQAERLAYVLHRAATRVPFYRAQWEARRRRGDRASWELLENWPLLLKESVRANSLAFVADDCQPSRMFHEHTSGTTGKPLDLWWSRATVRGWYALFEARARRWHGISSREPWGILGGQPVVSAQTSKPPFWVWNAPMRQLYLSANHISARNLRAFLQALARYRLTHLVAYSASVAVLAREAQQAGLTAPPLKAVITNAEPLFPWQRESIRAGLGCEARETYGMAEIIAAASECPHGKLHLWPEAGFLEVLQDASDKPVPVGEAGRLVSTSLLNVDMPFVRYVIGDRGRLAQAEERCDCGRTLPLLAGIEGRTNDLLLTRDGRRVSWLNPVFYGLPIREAQLVQETLDKLRVNYVPAPGFDQTAARTLTERLRLRLGDIAVELTEHDEVPRNQNGKFQAVVCRVNQG